MDIKLLKQSVNKTTSNKEELLILSSNTSDLTKILHPSIPPFNCQNDFLKKMDLL